MLTTVLLILNKCSTYHAGCVQRAAMCAHFKMAATRGLSATGCGAHDAARGPVSIDFFYSRARVGARGVAVP